MASWTSGEQRCPRPPVVTAAWVVILLVIGGLLVYATPLAKSVAPPSPHSLGSVTSSAGSNYSLVVDVNSGDSTAISYITQNVAPRLVSGDTLDITVDPSITITSAKISQVNTLAKQLAAAAPGGVRIADHTGYIPQIGALANGSASPIYGVAATYEPVGATSGLPGTQAFGDSYFSETHNLTQAKGLASIAYPTGSHILRTTPLWNYGEYASHVGQEWVETQEYCYASTSSFASAVQTMIGQFQQAGQPLSKLAVQVSIGGNKTNFVTPTAAVACVNAALAEGITSIYLWTEGGYESWLGTTIADLQRGSAPANVTAALGANPSTITLGAQVTFTTSAAGGYPPYSYAYTSLPKGCASANISTLQCTPTASGVFSKIGVTVTDSHGQQASASTTLTVDSPPPNSYAIKFVETGLPSGHRWNVTLAGQTVASTNTTVTFHQTNGAYRYSVATPLWGATGVRFVASPPNGTVTVSNASASVPIAYATQYNLSVTVSPVGTGTASPSGGWTAAGSVVPLSATPASGYLFSQWVGSGVGSYSGTAPSAEFTIAGPVSEVADFTPVNSTNSTSPTYPLTLAVTGLPAGENWSVVLNGARWTTDQTEITVPGWNGTVSYAFETPIPVSSTVEYVADPNSGSANLSSAPATVTMAYGTDAWLAGVASGSGQVNVTPAASGWYRVGTQVEFRATAPAGVVFAYWNGTGNGSYTGQANPVRIVIGGPIVEVAVFEPATAASGGGSGTSSLSALLSELEVPILVLSVIGVLVAMNLGVRLVSSARRMRRK